MSINLSLTEAFAKSTQPVGYSKICQVGQQEQQIPAIYSTLGSLISQLLGKSQSQQAFATHKLASHCANWQEWHRSETRLIFSSFLRIHSNMKLIGQKKKTRKNQVSSSNKLHSICSYQINCKRTIWMKCSPSPMDMPRSTMFKTQSDPVRRDTLTSCSTWMLFSVGA